MILSPKPLIFFLNISIACVTGMASYASHASAASDVTGVKTPKKSAPPRNGAKITRAGLPVRVTWQVIRSQGKGANMNTAAETFAAEGDVMQVAAHIWQLRLGESSINCALLLPKIGQDGRLVVQRREFFRLLGVELPPQDQIAMGEGEVDLSDVLQIPLMASPTRQLETVYRGPEEELYMIKLAISTPTRL